MTYFFSVDKLIKAFEMHPCDDCVIVLTEFDLPAPRDKVRMEQMKRLLPVCSGRKTKFVMSMSRDEYESVFRGTNRRCVFLVLDTVWRECVDLKLMIVDNGGKVRYQQYLFLWDEARCPHESIDESKLMIWCDLVGFDVKTVRSFSLSS